MCTLTSTTGESASVIAGIRGRLIELNESLTQNLNLITEKVQVLLGIDYRVRQMVLSV